MLRGYRLYILALGLILAAASPGGKAGNTQQQSPQNEISKSIDRVADALDEANKPKREASDCPEGGNDRKSDLCAQWKAADAANQTVVIGWVGVALGAVTMGAAIAAAIFARSAANHTKAGNHIARQSHEEALSPYVIASKAWFEIDEDMQPIAFIELKNFGQSPAIDVETWYHIWVECFPLHDPLPKPAEGEVIKSKGTLGPGGTSDIRHPRGNPLNGESQREIMAGRAAIYFYGESAYRDIFGNRFLSEFTFFARGENKIRSRRFSSYMDGNNVTRFPRERSDCENNA